MPQLDVVFGAAALGREIARQLAAKGHRVRLVSRRGAPSGIAGVESFRADASIPAQAIAACAGASVVYHCATPDYTKWEALYPPLQAGVIEGAASVRARLVSAESVYGYGPVDGPMVETLPQAATTRKGRVRTRLSQMLLDAHAQGRIRAVIARAPDFYGPEAAETTIYGDRVFYPALAGQKVSVMGKLDLPHTFIYVRDFARGMVTLGEQAASEGKAWHLPCAPTLTQRQLLGLLFAEAGHPVRVGETPGWVFSMMAPFLPIMRELKELLYQWERPYILDFSAFTSAFGALEPTSHEQAMRETVAWFRAHPKGRGGATSAPQLGSS